MNHTSRILVVLALLGLVACDDAPNDVVEPAPTEQVRVSLDTPVPTAVVTPSASPTSPTAPTAPSPEASARAAERFVEEAPAPRVELASDGGLTLRRLAITRRVEGREPVDPGTRFASRSERLYAFVEASNADEEARELVVSFFGPGNRHTGVVTLTIPAEAPRWRTWAYTSHATEPGAWTAEVRTNEGALVGRQAFVIE